MQQVVEGDFCLDAIGLFLFRRCRDPHNGQTGVIQFLK